MADVFDSLKKTWLKGMEVVGNTASNIASNTKQKVSEMNLENRRREILADFGLIAYEMWQKGTELPKELNDQLKELSRVDEELNALRAQRFKDVAETTEEADMKEEAEAAVEAVPSLLEEDHIEVTESVNDSPDSE